MQHTHITFPQIHLRPRDGHKLRGYFSNLFGEYSDLFHNHDSQGKEIYRYPLIQYKVADGVPVLVGINAGAELLIKYFLSIKKIEIEDSSFPVFQKDMKNEEIMVGVRDSMYSYRFVNPWMALNQKNFGRYMKMDEAARKKELERILTGNILNVLKAVGHFEKERIMVGINDIRQISTQFKNEKMVAFTGGFTSNVSLPNFIGLGKSVARGFGTIKRKE